MGIELLAPLALVLYKEILLYMMGECLSQTKRKTMKITLLYVKRLSDLGNTTLPCRCDADRKPCQLSLANKDDISRRHH